MTLSRLHHITQCSITFDLLDASGIVHHPNYLILCERARIEFLRLAGYSYNDHIRDGFGFVLRENHSEYFKPLRLEDSVEIISWVATSTRSTLSLTQEIYLHTSLESGNPIERQKQYDSFLSKEPVRSSSHELVYRLQIKLVCIQLETLRPTRMPDQLVTVLQLPEKKQSPKSQSFPDLKSKKVLLRSS